MTVSNDFGSKVLSCAVISILIATAAGSIGSNLGLNAKDAFSLASCVGAVASLALCYIVAKKPDQETPSFKSTGLTPRNLSEAQKAEILVQALLNRS